MNSSFKSKIFYNYKFAMYCRRIAQCVKIYKQPLQEHADFCDPGKFHDSIMISKLTGWFFLEFLSELG